MALTILLVSRSIISVPPNALVVLTGAKRTVTDPATGEEEIVGFRIVRDGSALRIPVLERADVLDLTEHTLEIVIRDVVDADGAVAAATLHVNAHIGAQGDLLERAIERLLGMSGEDVRQIVSSTAEAGFRSRASGLRFYAGVDWHAESNALAGRVREDLARIGVELDRLVVVPDRQVRSGTATATNGSEARSR